MDQEVREALIAQFTALADDEIVLAHRNSEWAGQAPILEEDIAFTNIALDEMGHAGLWYGQLAALLGEDPEAYPDRVIFFREAEAYRNVQMVELPNGDWAFSMMRQYLFDSAELARLEALSESAFAPLSETAAKILREELYHHRHTNTWVERLGLGTQESNARSQQALNSLFPYALQLFQPLQGEAALRSLGYVPEASQLCEDWQSKVRAHLSNADLRVPDGAVAPVHSRAEHTEHLAPLLTEMQMVARSDADAVW